MVVFYCSVVYDKSMSTGSEQRVTCDYGRPPPPGKVCDVDVKAWTPCTKANSYNYHKSAPCIFLKLNKVSFSYTQPCNSLLLSEIISNIGSVFIDIWLGTSVLQQYRHITK